MSNEHARRELKLKGFFDEESDYGGAIGKAVMELIDVFSKQGHSGFTAPVVASMFNKLAMNKPLGPLTGDDSEWVDVDGRLSQNIRCPHVFKTAEGAHDIRGKVFEDPAGGRYTNGDSKVEVLFPYEPTTHIVRVDDKGVPIVAPPS